uniref:Gamma-aminobutyric acid type B receptor subunit 2 n=1 Tax=Clastoptera arizonana TaxID=38151 RepID=A0A1B6EEM0_9HEMI
MWRFWLVLSFLFILVSGQFHCNLKKTEESPVKKYLRFKGIPRTVVLESSQRKFHQITTRILKIFLEEVLLYPNVTIVTKDDNFDNATLIFQRLYGNYGDELPETMINLEVWNPPNDNIINAELSEFVSDLGISGPPTRFGWFTPKSLLHLVPGMDIWRFFRTAESTKYFRLPNVYLTKILQSIRDKKSNRYFCEEPFCRGGIFSPEICENVTCATLLAGFFETTGFVIEHIRKLQLYVEVIWVGPQLEELVPFLTDELTKHNQTSLIFLSWTPSFIVTPNEETYSTIAFPPCEELDSSLMYCKYDLHKVIKLAWSRLRYTANPVHQLLMHVSFTLKEYEEFFQIYQNETKHNTRQDEVMDKVACHWMKTHSNNITTWKNKIRYNNELYIAGIFPLTGSNYNMAGSISQAAALATEAVNKSKILEGYQLKLFSDDGMCQPDVVMKVFINYVMQNRFKQLVGILGPACSDTVEPLAGVSRHFHTVVISYSAEGSSFSDRKKYPYFFRTIGENNQYQQVYLQLLQHLKWAKIGALAEDGHKYSEYLSHMQLVLKKNNITFEFNNKFPPQGNIENIKQYLQEMVQENIRIIIGDVYDDVARTVMCIAYQMGMTAYNSYVWFLPSWLSSDWYDTDKYNKKNNESVECSTEQMVMAINGYFSLSHAPFGPEDSLTHENITVKQWKENFMKSGTNYSTPDKISDYAGYAYDAVWMYAYALRKLYDENSTHLSGLHNENTTKRLVEILKETNFQGVSGTVQFRGRASRISVVHVNQWYFNKSTDKVKSIVGIFEPNNSINNQDPLAGKLKVDDYLIHWLTPDGEIPKDGMIPPPLCLVEGFKNLLGVKDCEIAIVIANVMGFLFIGSILLIVFIRFYQIKKDELEKIKNNNDVLNIANKLDKWEIARVNVVINRKIGEGAFGYVYGGEAFFDGSSRCKNLKNWFYIRRKTRFSQRSRSYETI